MPSFKSLCVVSNRIPPFKVFIPRAPLAAGVAAAHWAATLLGAGAAVDDGLPGVACAALPPHTPPAARGDVLRREGAVEGRVPLAGDGWVEGGEVVVADKHFFIGTVGASAAAHGAAGDDCLVVVAFFTAPPDFFVAGWGDFVWRECAVFAGMPLSGNGWIKRSQVVKPCQHFLASADGAAAAVDAAGNAGLVVMAFLTVPPHFAAGAGHHVRRRESAIFRRVPLPRQVRIKTCEIIIPSLHLLVAADGTASAVDTGFYLCPPLVPMAAAPPGHVVAAWQHVVGSKVTVFRRVPFFCQIRIASGEIGFTGNGQTPAAIGTSSAAAGARVHGGLPVVPLGAGPPDMLFAAMADGFRGERQVPCLVPLFQ